MSPQLLPDGETLLFTRFPASLWWAWRRAAARDLAGEWSVSVEGRVAASAALMLTVGATAMLSTLVYPTAPAPVNDVAVLSFESRGSDPVDERLGERLAWQLQDHLGELTELSVVSRSSSDVFRGSDFALTGLPSNCRRRGF